MRGNTRVFFCVSSASDQHHHIPSHCISTRDNHAHYPLVGSLAKECEEALCGELSLWDLINLHRLLICYRIHLNSLLDPSMYSSFSGYVYSIHLVPVGMAIGFPSCVQALLWYTVPTVCAESGPEPQQEKDGHHLYPWMRWTILVLPATLMQVHVIVVPTIVRGEGNIRLIKFNRVLPLFRLL
jgi:hypothetical protein